MYGSLAEVYDFLVPEPLLSPEGSVAAFAMVTDELPAGARVLDCACGTGTLAVGLALQGFEVAASDASPAMVARTQELAAQHGAEVAAATRAWQDLGGEPFDAVLCVGNSLTHAGGRAGRRTALDGMRRVLRDGGLLAITSRNWELPQEGGEEVVERGGRRATVRRVWLPPELSGGAHSLDLAVTLDDGAVHRERLPYWPFTYGELDEDLRAAGFEPASSTWAADVDRYLVTSRANSSNASR
jgi:SAM-dependent methyltransferase